MKHILLAMNQNQWRHERDPKLDDAWTKETTDKAMTNKPVPLTTKIIKYLYMTMPGCGIIASSDHFLLDPYQDLLDLDFNFPLTGTFIGIPRKHTSWCAISWENNFLMTKIQNKSPYTEVMKCNKSKVKLSFGAWRKLDRVYPKAKPRQRLERSVIESSSHNDHATLVIHFVFCNTG